jgi:hypothetical protein
MSNPPINDALLFKRNSAGVVVGMTTPANSDADAAVAVAAALGFSFDAQGNIVANIVPRTGTLASLLALDGGIGELSSATDFPAIVKHDGVAGEAVALMPFGAVRVTPITAVTFNFGAVSVRPDVRVQVLNPTNIGSGTLSLGNGYFIGQPLRLYMLTGGGGGTLTGLALTGGTTSLSSNQILDLVWNGSSWTLENSFFMGGNGFLALSVLGAGPAAGDGSLAIGSGAATAAAAKNATAVGPVQAFTPNEVAIGVGSYARKRYNSLSTVTTSATPKEATTDRNTAASTNRINFSTSAGMYRVKATISAKDGAGANILTN